MAKQLYDYWFVQFDFPNEDGKPYKSSGGKMVWNDKLKREIPEGWEVPRISDVCSRIQSGGTPLTSCEEFYDGDISWYRTQELCDKWLFDSSIKISESAVENSSAKWFDANSVVIAIYASPTCGRLGLLANGGTFNQACCGLVSSDKCSMEYLFMWLKENRVKLNTLASGTAQKNLNVEKVKNFEILLPEERIIKLWTAKARSIFSSLKASSWEIELLTKQRDELLPLLMNGQVSVNYHLSVQKIQTLINKQRTSFAEVEYLGLDRSIEMEIISIGYRFPLSTLLDLFQQYPSVAGGWSCNYKSNGCHSLCIYQ